MNYLLAIDQSTSGTKVVLFDERGAVVDKSTRAHQQLYPRAGWVEHDAEEIWSCLMTAARDLLRRHDNLLADIVGVSLTNQRETFLVMERGTGKPLHPAIVWQCRRGDALCAEQRGQGLEQRTLARTGLRIDGYFSAPKMQWLLRDQPEIARRIANGAALFATIDAWLIHRLTDGKTFATDYTNASRTLLFDIDRLQWDRDLCESWEVPPQALPEPRASDAQFGTTTLAGLLPRAVPIRGVMGDSQAAMFAQQCFAPGNAKVTLGTGASILLNIGHQRCFAPRAITSLAWVREGVPTYALEGMVNSAAATLTWLRDQLGFMGRNEDAEALANEVADSGGVYLVPAFSGLGAPYWSDKARAAILGLTAHSDRRHILRAALESIAFQVHDIIELLRAEAGVPVTRLRCDGGLTRNALLMQQCADIVGVELQVANNPDCSALGAARMGLLGLGLLTPVQVLAPPAGHTYHRQLSADQVSSRCRGWRNAVNQVLGGARGGAVDTGGNSHDFNDVATLAAGAVPGARARGLRFET